MDAVVVGAWVNRVGDVARCQAESTHVIHRAHRLLHDSVGVGSVRVIRVSLDSKQAGGGGQAAGWCDRCLEGVRSAAIISNL